MSHEPPVPPGNTSPYPIQEAPHPPSVPPVPVAAEASRSKPSTPEERSHRLPLGAIAGAAAGAGAIAFGIAALLFPRDGKAKPRSRKRAD